MWFQDADFRRLILAPESSAAERESWFQNLPFKTDYRIWGIEHAGRPVGAYGVKNIDGKRAEYWGYLADRSLWGQGLGNWIMETAFGKAAGIGLDTLYLKVNFTNRRALRLYERHGFRQTRQEGDVVWMARRI